MTTEKNIQTMPESKFQIYFLDRSQKKIRMSYISLKDQRIYTYIKHTEKRLLQSENKQQFKYILSLWAKYKNGISLSKCKLRI